MDKATKEHFREKLLAMKKELIEALNSKYNEALELGSDGIQDTADEAYNLYNKNIMLGRVETDALKVFGKSSIQPPSQVGVNAQVAIGSPFTADVYAPLEFAEIGGEIISRFRHIHLGAGGIAFTQVTVVGRTGKLAVRQIGQIRTELDIPTRG